MKEQPHTDFTHSAQAIDHLRRHYPAPTTLEKLASELHLNPTQLQDAFARASGVCVHEFLQQLTLLGAKKSLATSPATRLKPTAGTACCTAKAFVHILPISTPHGPNEGRKLVIRYGFAQTLFGPVLCASTDQGLCFLGFADNPQQTLDELRQLWPGAAYQEQSDTIQQQALEALHQPTPNYHLSLHLKATNFQRQVWEALLDIPAGERISYGELARRIGQPKACRAVGSAVGQNPVSLLIPCHRVVQSTGALGGYHWGPQRKATLLSWEAARNQP